MKEETTNLQIVNMQGKKKRGIFGHYYYDFVTLEGLDEEFDYVTKESDEFVIFYKNDNWYLYSRITGKLLFKYHDKIKVINRYIIVQLEDEYEYQFYYFDSKNDKLIKRDELYTDFCEISDNLILAITITGYLFVIDAAYNQVITKIEIPVSLENIHNLRLCYRPFYKDKNMVCIRLRFKEGDRNIFIVFDLESNRFPTETFIFVSIYRDIKSVKVYDGKLYIIFDDNILRDEHGNIIIDKFYSYMYFHSIYPYVFLEKNGKCGLAKIDGTIVFETIYDEIMETPEKFVVNVREIKEYIKEKAKN